MVADAFLVAAGFFDAGFLVVDKKTGEVYKPASVKAPAKGVRYNMLLINSREEMFRRADWAGGYLYMKG